MAAGRVNDVVQVLELAFVVGAGGLSEEGYSVCECYDNSLIIEGGIFSPGGAGTVVLVLYMSQRPAREGIRGRRGGGGGQFAG